MDPVSRLRYWSLSSTNHRLISLVQVARIKIVYGLLQDPINAHLIGASLPTASLGKPIYYYPEITSTNIRLKELAAKGSAEGTLVIADFQSSGRGRLARSWIAPKGSSLLFSLLFKPGWPIEQYNWLQMIGGLAVIESIRSLLHLDVELKWPNDVVVNIGKTQHKIAGLLLELQTVGGSSAIGILGIGINVNNIGALIPGAAAPAASLSDVLSHPVERLPLLVKLIQQLDERYNAALKGESPQLDWEKALTNIGSEVAVSDSNTNEMIHGLAIGTDTFGRLLVRDKYSNVHKISAGNVTLRS